MILDNVCVQTPTNSAANFERFMNPFNYTKQLCLLVDNKAKQKLNFDYSAQMDAQNNLFEDLYFIDRCTYVDYLCLKAFKLLQLPMVH